MKCSKRWPSRLAGFVCVELLRWEAGIRGGTYARVRWCVCDRVRVCVCVCGGARVRVRVRWYACAGTVRHVNIPLTNQV
jgi:hypothetical protein